MLAANLASFAIRLNAREEVQQETLARLKRCVEVDPFNVRDALFGTRFSEAPMKLLQEPIEWRSKYLNLRQQVHFMCQYCRAGAPPVPNVNVTCRKISLLEHTLARDCFDELVHADILAAVLQTKGCFGAGFFFFLFF